MSAPPLRVLVCDDELQILRGLRIVLREAGFDVVAAQSAQAALDLAALHPPEAAIVDLVLPDGDGVDVCRQLRGWSQMPIIVLSAVGDEDVKIAALDAGADDYVTKPFGLSELTARISALLRRSRMLAPAAAGPTPRTRRERGRGPCVGRGAGLGVAVREGARGGGDRRVRRKVSIYRGASVPTTIAGPNGTTDRLSCLNATVMTPAMTNVRKVPLTTAGQLCQPSTQPTRAAMRTSPAPIPPRLASAIAT